MEKDLTRELIAAFGPPPPSPITNPALSDRIRTMAGTEFIGSLISNLISLALIIAALIFFFMLLAGGIQYITSGGDKAATESARGRITSAVVGIVIVFSVWAVMLLVETFLGITIIRGPIKLPTL